MTEDKKAKIRKFRLAPPPQELPIYGEINPAECCFLGRTNYEAPLEEKKFVFGIKRNDRKKHIYIVGKSGSGKSKLLELLIRQDIAYGHGLALIDPYGNLVKDLLDFIPEERINDVVLVDPSDENWPIAFNPLKNVSPKLKNQTVQDLIEILKELFSPNWAWTPTVEHVFRFACLALLDYPQATIPKIIPMLTDRKYRENVIKFIKDKMVKRFWEIEFEGWSKKFKAEAIVPLSNKLTQFFSNPYLSNIFSQEKNKINLEQIIKDKKVLLVSLSKGRLGAENAAFLGSIFISKIYQAGMARENITQEEKPDFYLYLDDFYNIVTPVFENLFTEARKYGFSLTVTHQYLEQLRPETLAMILGNVGTTIIFQVGGTDAKKLETEMAPVFKANDMINLGTREFFIKMTIDGESFDPFSAQTLFVGPPPHRSRAKKIREESRKKYATPLSDLKKQKS